MQLIETIEGFRKALEAERSAGRSVGLVPTMGFLHEGHLSLMGRAGADCDAVAATIFLNPLQFGTNEDLDPNPPDLARDQVLTAAGGVSYLFATPAEEMNPGGARATTGAVRGSSAGL